MACRFLLHKKHEEEFKQWLQKEGYEIFPVKGEWETIRAKKNGKWFIAYEKMGAKEHFTVMGKDVAMVHRFINEQNKKKRG